MPFISLADIAWQLIIFFLVTSTFTKNDAMTLELPNSSEESSQEQQQDTITVQAGEQALMLNENPVELKDLEKALAALLAGKTTDAERVVVLMPADDLTFQRNVEVTLAIKRSGGIVAIMGQDEQQGGGE
ncbi:MAG: biopolymer transporter ExbD [Planctomycetes bacterium]|nr:biopolymer transporter ExbD [Planctomycetota bacterium]